MGCGWLGDDRGAVEATAAVSRRGWARQQGAV